MFRNQILGMILIIIVSISVPQSFAESSIIVEIESLEKFPEVWTIGQGKIVNTIGDTFVYPDVPLEYQVSITNPKDEDRKLTIWIKIFKGGELTEIIERDWWIQENSSREISFPFYLKEEGSHKLEIRLVFDRQIPGSEHPNWTFHIPNIPVQSLSNKLQAESNFNNVILYIGIIGAAVGGNIFSIIYLRRQSRATEKQLLQNERQINQFEKEQQYRFRPWIKIIPNKYKQTSVNVESTLTVENIGQVPAKTVYLMVHVSHTKFDRKELWAKGAKKGVFPLLPNETQSYIVDMDKDFLTRSKINPVYFGVHVAYDTEDGFKTIGKIWQDVGTTRYDVDYWIDDEPDS